MRDILKVLNSEAGAAGSMVITPDGIMVAAALGPAQEEDSMAAFASSFLLTLRRGLARLKASGAMTSCTLAASSGKLAFFNMQNSYLVVLAHPGLALDGSMPCIRAAMEKIRNRKIA